MSGKQGYGEEAGMCRVLWGSGRTNRDKLHPAVSRWILSILLWCVQQVRDVCQTPGYIPLSAFLIWITCSLIHWGDTNDTSLYLCSDREGNVDGKHLITTTLLWVCPKSVGSLQRSCAGSGLTSRELCRAVVTKPLPWDIPSCRFNQNLTHLFILLPFYVGT